VHVPHAWDAPGIGYLTDDADVDALTGMPQCTAVPVTISPA
jgi:hypothetical protein